MRRRNQGAALRRRPTAFDSSRSEERILVTVTGSDADCRARLRDALEFAGYAVTEAVSGNETIREADSGLYALIIVDSGMEAITPHELCRRIRLKSNMGIIVLTTEECRQSEIDALNAGADDYVPAPFVVEELMARVRAILRRVSQSGGDRQIVLEDRRVDLRSHEIKGPGGHVKHLTPKEYLVLQYLISPVNMPRTPQSLSQAIWQRDGVGDVEYVRAIIRQLRRKLEANPEQPRYILTERSIGYRFQIPSEVQSS